MKTLFILLSALVFLVVLTACNRHPKPSGSLDEQLQVAVKSKNASSVQRLLHDGANLESKDVNGNTPLMLATDNEDIAMMKLLLQNNANVEATDRYGETSLVKASRGYNADAVSTLLTKVSDVHDEEQALLAVSVSGPIGVIQLSPAEAAALKPQQQTSDSPQVAIMKLLLDRNISIETRDDEGSAPLMLASSHGQIEMVRLLLDRGAQVDARDNFGNTALIASACACAQATMRPTYDILGLLLDKGAEINAQSKDGSTALMYATTGFEIENAELLIKRGANLRIKDKKGKTALQWAVENKRSKAIQLLKTALASD